MKSSFFKRLHRFFDASMTSIKETTMSLISNIKNKVRGFVIESVRNEFLQLNEKLSLQNGKMLTNYVNNLTCINTLSDVEFKIFSQWGDDGIIQYLISHLDIENETFIEFGVSDYQESNTRFLMMNNNWSGLIIDASEDNIKRIKQSDYYWKYDLEAKAVFIDRENINDLISSRGFDKNIGLLHIDLDGNDYWIWKEINCIHPIILILEYNSIFGNTAAITIPYDKSFYRTTAHYSNLYWGASLRALCLLSQEKGYTFIGCTSSGNNAYFIRNDKMNSSIHEVSIKEGYVKSKSRESRNTDYSLSYVTGDDRRIAISGLQVFNIETGVIETLS